MRCFRFPSLFFFLATLAVAAPREEPISQVIPGHGTVATAQPPAALTTSGVPGAPPKPAAGPGDAGFTPTWETQKHAQTFMLGIPAPRGQIVDRNGEPLAQTRVSYNLGMSFPTPLNFSDQEVIRFAQQQVLKAQSITGRPISLTQEQVLKHYKNRGIVPMLIAQDLRPPELESFHRTHQDHLTLMPVYQRFYPNGPLAAHIIGYAQREGRTPDGPMENNEMLWPNSKGREGLEKSFDDQLQGKIGQYNISFDASGRKASEQISIPPQPGYNIVTTLDSNIQRLCEQALEKGCKRGAMVIIDPNTGDILAMASWPEFNPNSFVPSISNEDFKALNDNPDIPLYPRAFRAAYPPGSTFKVVVGLAALESGKIEPDEEFSCPAAMEIGNLTFRNWKKKDSGMLNFVEALTQSCDTWFYQVGMKIGPHLIIDYAQQLGLGQKTGIPLNDEADGLIPTDEFMLRAHKRKLQGGDVANLSIGQGDTTVTPLQLAQTMGAVAMGGTLHQTRLVQQVQSIDGQIVTGYDIRVKGQVEIDKAVMNRIRKGMVQVVSSASGTAGRAQVPNVDVAGKTGTAEWGPKKNEKTAAWFSGFAPADKPRYAFAVVYEGDAGLNDIHGGTFAAPLVGKVMKELFKGEKPEKKKKKSDEDDEDSSDDNSDAPPSHHSHSEEAPPPPPPPKKPASVPFWKKWFQ
jgi:penicillin-binding protein 2